VTVVLGIALAIILGILVFGFTVIARTAARSWDELRRRAAPKSAFVRALLRGFLLVVPLTFLGLFLCMLAAHSDLPLAYVCIPLIPMAVLIRFFTGRDIGQPGMMSAFWVLQGIYYGAMFVVIESVRQRLRSGAAREAPTNAGTGA